MKPPNHPAIRAYLRTKPEGVTVAQMQVALGKEASSIRRALGGMPDVYIDRWTAPVRGQYQAVYCVVIPPEHCPHPRDVQVRTDWNRKFYLPQVQA